MIKLSLVTVFLASALTLGCDSGRDLTEAALPGVLSGATMKLPSGSTFGACSANDNLCLGVVQLAGVRMENPRLWLKRVPVYSEDGSRDLVIAPNPESVVQEKINRDHGPFKYDKRGDGYIIQGLEDRLSGHVYKALDGVVVECEFSVNPPMSYNLLADFNLAYKVCGTLQQGAFKAVGRFDISPEAPSKNSANADAVARPLPTAPPNTGNSSAAPAGGVGSQSSGGAASAVVAVINDPDGYVNIRRGPSTRDEVVGKILEGERFVVTSQQGNWWGVEASDKRHGYVHSSRIKIVR